MFQEFPTYFLLQDLSNKNRTSSGDSNGEPLPPVVDPWQKTRATGIPRFDSRLWAYVPKADPFSLLFFHCHGFMPVGHVGETVGTHVSVFLVLAVII